MSLTFDGPNEPTHGVTEHFDQCFTIDQKWLIQSPNKTFYNWNRVSRIEDNIVHSSQYRNQKNEMEELLAFNKNLTVAIITCVFVERNTDSHKIIKLV